MKRLGRRLRDLRLEGKVALLLATVFVAIVAVFLGVLLGVQREQRLRLLDHDRRLISTLREKYDRDFIYDALSRNDESLAVDAADLARQPGIVWIRVEQNGTSLMATADPAAIRRVLKGDHEELPEGVVLLVREEGGELVGSGGRRLAARVSVIRERLPAWHGGTNDGSFTEISWGGARTLYSVAALRAADEVYGRLHILYSLAELGRGEARTRTVFYGLLATTFVLVLLLLNLLLSRIVLRPVQAVLEAMGEASTGSLEVRLPVHSRDEFGTMAASFNRMVEELAGSKREIEGYSRELEERVEERTAELRHSEESLLRLKDHLATVIANVATGVVSLDAEGRITTFNERAVEILSLAGPALEGRRLVEVLDRKEDRALLDFVAEVVAGRTDLRKGQVVFDLPPGRRTLSLVASALKGPGRRAGTVLVFDDLTQILASQRLEGWKEAVEKVIHEIKNPLTPVGLAAQTLRTAYEEDRQRFGTIFPSAIEMILSSVQDLKALIADFARFSRLPKIVLRRQDLNAMVREALTPYEHGAGPGIEVRHELDPSLPAVAADADQLKRVLLNVIHNAIEAMEGRAGEVRVRTEGPDDSGRVAIAVEDQGVGIEEVERIFEPHFTTKVKGTGLGLAIARQIVDEHGGEIRVVSRPGQGTAVTILLPAAEPPAGP